MEKMIEDRLRFAKRLQWRLVLSSGVVIYATRNADGSQDDRTIYWPSDNPKKLMTAAELAEGQAMFGRTLVFLPCDGRDCSFEKKCPCGDR